MRKKNLSILLISFQEKDSIFFSKLIEQIRSERFNFKITLASDLDAALKIVAKTTFDLMIYELNSRKGFDLKEFSKLYDAVHFTPIVVVSDKYDPQLAIEAIRLGAQDFLLLSEITAFLLERTVFYAIERHHLREALRALSFTDELTRLYNRRGFLLLARQQREIALRLKKGFCIFMFDLDFLKKINDQYGHQEGDTALVESAKILKRAFRTSDIIARIGGDEFAVLCFQAREEDRPLLIQNFENQLAEFNRSEKRRPYTLSISLGIAHCEARHPKSINTLLSEADKKLYTLKKSRG